MVVRGGEGPNRTLMFFFFGTGSQGSDLIGIRALNILKLAGNTVET